MNLNSSGVSSIGPRQDPMKISSIIGPNVGDGSRSIGTTRGDKFYNVGYILRIRQ
jgi:hypothetical protein